MNRFFGHLKTITTHRHAVIRHAFKAGIGFQGLFHDLSKYSPTEFVPGVKYYQGTRSPNERERELFGYSLAWMHHKGRNRHHFEYWNDLNTQTKRYESVKMPMRYLKEMFCDRVAASKIYGKEKYHDAYALEYFKRGNARAKMHPDTADMLEFFLTMLAQKGEKEAFAYIKAIRNDADYEGARVLEPKDE